MNKLSQNRSKNTFRENGRYQLSKKLGYIKIRKRDKLRYPIEQMTQWTVKREGDKYYIVFLFTVEVEPQAETTGAVGIDLGIKDFVNHIRGRKNRFTSTNWNAGRQSHQRTAETLTKAKG